VRDLWEVAKLHAGLSTVADMRPIGADFLVSEEDRGKSLVSGEDVHDGLSLVEGGRWAS